ncbi:MAG: MFS transporter [Acidimicrobiales bacterium]
MISSLQPLRHRNFALVWSAALVSNVGSWMQTVAVGVLVTARTGHPAWTALVAAAGFLPSGLLSPFGGVLADRVERRRLFLATTVGETAFAAVLAALAATGRPSAGAVTLLVLGGGCMAALGFPAYQAIMPDLVPRPELGAAISLSSAQFNLGRVVGPALAGIAIAAGGYTWAFGVNAASFGAVVVALLLLRLPPRASTASNGSVVARLAAGARATAADPACRWAVLLISVVALTASPFIALVPAVALEALHGGAPATSVLVTAQGVGAVAGALALTPLVHRFGRRRLLVVDIAAVCAALVAYGLAPDLPLAAGAMVLVGAGYIGVLAGCSTTIQLHAPPELRGRILGIYMMALGVFYPVGALAQGAIADRVGVRAVTVGGAALLGALLAAVIARRLPATIDQVPEGAGAREGTTTS